MRTSLNEIAQVDEYLMGNLSPADDVLFQAKIVLNKDLAENVRWQQKAHETVCAYGRQQLEQEIAAVQQKLFSDPEHNGFCQKILRLFRRR